MQVIPSASNTAGTLLGTLAGGLVLAHVTTAVPLILFGTTLVTFTPAMLAVIATLAVNYAATHIAEVKNLNDLVSAWWPQFEATFPGTRTLPYAQGPKNSNINQLPQDPPPGSPSE